MSLKPGVKSVQHTEDNQRGVVGELTLNGDVTFGITLCASHPSSLATAGLS